MEKEEQKRKSWPLIAIIILLLLAIGILLWLLLRPQPEPEKIPTGNVDVFGIRIGYICRNPSNPDCEEDEDDFIPHIAPHRKGATENSEKKINGNDEEETEVEREGIVYVDDKEGRYVYLKKLKIFENAAFEYTNKIAPGVSNSYNFKVHNETDNAIKYNIEFEESSEYNINMLYRLKRGSTYVVGDDDTWVSANELKTTLKNLSSDGIDSYTLDWEWPYEGGVDAADTEAGEKMTSDYRLDIKINFEEA